LHGQSALPLFLGFGCNVPAVIGARVVDDRRARLLTMLLAPLVPCASRLAVVAFLAPAFFGSAATLVSWGLVAGNLALLAAVGRAVHQLIFKGERGLFIMEMPLYHRPSARTIGLYVWRNLLSFVQRAGTLIVFASAIVWLLAALPGDGQQPSLLAQAGHWLEPFGRPLGLGDWRLIVALLSGFVAKESTLATLAVVYETSGNLGLADQLAGTLTPAAASAFLVIQMTFIPCAATLATIRQETASWKWTAFSAGLQLAISFAAGWVVYQLAALVLG
jgi:ferrous iron transport protein B